MATPPPMALRSHLTTEKLDWAEIKSLLCFGDSQVSVRRQIRIWFRFYLIIFYLIFIYYFAWDKE
jgi:hypothetical protein